MKQNWIQNNLFLDPGTYADHFLEMKKLAPVGHNQDFLGVQRGKEKIEELTEGDYSDRLGHTWKKVFELHFYDSHNVESI